jgi:hypothetical protein
MNDLPEAVVQPDGACISRLKPPQLLHRVLGDVWQSLAVYEEHCAANELELVAIDELQELLRPTGRLPTLATRLGFEPAPKQFRRLNLVK